MYASYYISTIGSSIAQQHTISRKAKDIDEISQRI